MKTIVLVLAGLVVGCMIGHEWKRDDAFQKYQSQLAQIKLNHQSEINQYKTDSDKIYKQTWQTAVQELAKNYNDITKKIVKQYDEDAKVHDQKSSEWCRALLIEQAKQIEVVKPAQEMFKRFRIPSVQKPGYRGRR